MSEATGSWVEARPLDRRIVVVWTVQEAVGYGLLALALLAAGLVAVAALPAAWWLPRASYRHWRYQVAADALELQHGVVRRVHSAIPYFRVQHIDVAQGPARAMPSEGPGAGPRRLHLLSPVFFAVGHARRLWPLALLIAARRQWWLLALGALVLLAWTTVEWLRRTYALEGGALRLEEGVLSRQLRAVPFDRIQQVDLVRK